MVGNEQIVMWLTGTLARNISYISNGLLLRMTPY